MEVHHRARRAGQSKYGLSRTFKVLLDLMVVKFLASLRDQADLRLRRVRVRSASGSPPPPSSGRSTTSSPASRTSSRRRCRSSTVMFALVGALSLLMGLLAELVIRTYYESQNKRPYLVAEELNRPPPALPRAAGNLDVRHLRRRRFGKAARRRGRPPRRAVPRASRPRRGRVLRRGTGRARASPPVDPRSLDRRPADDPRRRHADLQRRGLRLRAAARRAAREGPSLHHPQRHRGGAARLSAMGRGVRRARPRHVRARDLGLARAQAGAGARSPGQEAALLLRRRPALRLRLAS